jgi:hypothetical protein
MAGLGTDVGGAISTSLGARVGAAAKRADAPSNYWHKEAEPLSFGRDKFRLTVLRPSNSKKPNLSLDGLCEAFSWVEDSKSVLSGSISVRLPTFDPRGRFDLTFGDMVVCQVSRVGSDTFREVWRMRVNSPEFQIADSVYQWELVDDLVRLGESKGDFKYRKSKLKPNGWLGHQVIAEVAKQYGFQLGRIPKLRHRIKKLTMTNVSPLAVIGRVLRYERIAYGSRYFIRWNQGRLDIVPYQRSAELLAMSKTIIDGTYSLTKTDGFATSVTVTGARKVKESKKDSKGHDRTKKKAIQTRVDAAAAIKRYGRIHKKIKAPDSADTHAELVTFGKHYLAKHSVPKRELTFTHPGIWSLRRGAALRLTIEDAGINNTIVYVTEVDHNVGQGNDYTMDVTVQFDDPFKKSADQQKKLLCEKARKNNRKLPAGCPKQADDDSTPKPKKAGKRS